MEQVRATVTEVFGPLNPREDITLARLSELTLQVRKNIEGSTEQERRSKKWLTYLLPPSEEEENVLQESGVFGVSEPPSPQTASKLRHLLDETADLIESPSFAHVVTLLNNEGFSTLVEQKCAADAFKPSHNGEMAPQSFDSVATVIPPPNLTPKTKLANVLAVMARQAHVIGNGANPPNEYLAAMDQGVRELDAFAAVVYSSNFDNELLSSGLSPGILPVDLADVDTSSSYAPVLVDKGPDVTMGDGNDSANASNSEGAVSGADLVQSLASEPDFEVAWGKAVEEKHDSREK